MHSMLGLKNGSGCMQEMGLFALWYFRSGERKFPVGNDCSRERKHREFSLPEAFAPGNFRSPDRSENDRELLLPRIFRSPLKRRTFAFEVQCVIVYTLFVYGDYYRPAVSGLFVPLHFRSRERKVHRENFPSCGTFVSWNIRSRGAKSPRNFVPWNFLTPGTIAPQERMFQELPFRGTFAPVERSLHKQLLCPYNFRSC